MQSEPVYGTPSNIKAKIFIDVMNYKYMKVLRRHKATTWYWNKLTPASQARWSRLIDKAEQSGVRGTLFWYYIKEPANV